MLHCAYRLMAKFVCVFDAGRVAYLTFLGRQLLGVAGNVADANSENEQTKTMSWKMLNLP